MVCLWVSDNLNPVSKTYGIQTTFPYYFRIYNGQMICDSPVPFNDYVSNMISLLPKRVNEIGFFSSGPTYTIRLPNPKQFNKNDVKFYLQYNNSVDSKAIRMVIYINQRNPEDAKEMLQNYINAFKQHPKYNQYYQLLTNENIVSVYNNMKELYEKGTNNLVYF